MPGGLFRRSTDQTVTPTEPRMLVKFETVLWRLETVLAVLVVPFVSALVSAVVVPPTLPPPCD